MEHFLELKAETKSEIDYVITNDIAFLSVTSKWIATDYTYAFHL
jgi:hypothetical protein